MQARADSRSAIDFLVTENGRRSIDRFLEPVKRQEQVSVDLLGSIGIGQDAYSLPRLTFRGPNSSDPIRIGLFAGIHGVEPAGPLAAAQFLLDLVREPGPA